MAARNNKEVMKRKIFKAVRNGDSTIVKNLLDAGIASNYKEPEHVQNNCRSLIHIACKNGHKEIASMLLEDRRDNVHSKDALESSPLHYAARGNHTEIAELLLTFGADIDAKDMGGDTAMHCAVRQKHMDMIRLLAEKGADIQAINQFGETVLHVAISYDTPSTEIVRELLQQGADPHIENNNQVTVFMIARDKKQDNILHLLERRHVEPETPPVLPLADGTHKFDIFVSFCDEQEDGKWVRERLFPFLQEHNFHCCYENKDFEVGKAKIDNIADAVEASRRTILVLSKRFMNDGFKQEELKMAHYKRAETMKNCLFAIILDDDTQIPTSIKAHTVLRVTNEDNWEEKLLRELRSAE